jgi:hypothetical protein
MSDINICKMNRTVTETKTLKFRKRRKLIAVNGKLRKARNDKKESFGALIGSKELYGATISVTKIIDE